MNDRFFRELIRSSLEAILVFSHEGQIVFYNSPAAELFHFADIAPDLLRNICHLFQFLGSGEPFCTTLQNSLQTGKFPDHPIRVMVSVPPGRGQYLEVQFTQVSSPSQAEAVVVANFRNITQETITRTLVFDSEIRLKLLLQSNIFGFFVGDVFGNILEANQAFLELLGYSQEDLNAGVVQWETITPIESREIDRKAFESSLITGFSPPYHKEFIHKNGHRISVMVGYAFLNPERTVGMCVVIDLTERNKREEEQFKAGKLESIGVLAGGIAHDFNNLLTAILGNASLAKQYLSPDADRVASKLEAIEKAVGRAKLLASQLLTFSNGGILTRKPIELASFIQKYVPGLLTTTQTQFEWHSEPVEYIAEIDEDQIKHVLSILVSNACEAMGGGGIIRLSATIEEIRSRTYHVPIPDGDYIKIEFQDTGAGIPTGVLDRIFDPYFTTKQTGTGLGLAIAFSIMKNHGGYITALSQTHGARFQLLFPLAHIPHDKTSTRIVTSYKGGTLQPHRVLIMDDEAIIRLALQEYLEVQGFQVEPVANGELAVEQYSEALKKGIPFSIVVLDLTVKHGSGGRQTIQKLIEIDPNVQAIVCSGYSQDGVMANYHAFGFQAKLEKPFQFYELRDLIVSILSTNEE